MALTVTSNLNEINDCDVIAGWLPAPNLVDDIMREGVGCCGEDVDVGTERFFYTLGAQTDYSGTHFYVWLMCVTPTLDTKALGGMQICAEDNGGNQSYWHVAGSDTYSGGWECFCIDTDSTPDDDSGTPADMSICTKVGVGFKCVGKSKLAENCHWDFFREGVGMTVTGGTAVAKGDWDEVLAGDLAAAVGIVRKVGGVYFLRGPIIFGDTGGAADLYFKDVGKVVIWEDGAVSSTHYKISVVGNAGKITSFEFGTKVGTVGTDGIFMDRAGSAKYAITCTDANVDTFVLYGSTFQKAGTITFSTSGHEVLNTNFNACDEVIAALATLTNCTFNNSVDRGVRVVASHNISDCAFNNCLHGVHFNVATTYGLFNFVFTNCTYDIENSIADAVTVNCSGTTNAGTYENTGGGSTSIVNTKVLEINGVRSLSVQITHGAITGDDSAFKIGYYLRGLTSGAVGRIIEDIDGTHTIVRVASGTFSSSETVNETTDGTAGGDTGDSAATSAVANEYVQCAIYAAAGGVETEGTELMNEEANQSTGDGFFKATQDYNYGGSQPVTIRARYQGWKSFLGTGTITGDFTVTAVWQEDPNYGLV